MRTLVVLVLALLGASASAQKSHPPYDTDPDHDNGIGNDPPQSDMGSGGDASNVCTAPNPRLVPGDGGTARAAVPGDPADVYAFDVPMPGAYFVVVTKIAGTPDVEARIWDAPCGTVLATGEPDPQSGAKVITFLAPSAGAFPLEIRPVLAGGSAAASDGPATASDPAPSCWPSCILDYEIGSGFGLPQN